MKNIAILAIGILLGAMLGVYYRADPQESPPFLVIATDTADNANTPKFDLADLPVAILQAGKDLHVHIPIDHYIGGMQIAVTVQANTIILTANDQQRTFKIDTKGVIDVYFSDIREDRSLWILDAHIRE